MGLDCKLIIRNTSVKFDVDRYYNIDNSLLEALGLRCWIYNNGIPVYMLLSFIDNMQDLKPTDILYDDIHDWLSNQDEFDYVSLITEEHPLY